MNVPSQADTILDMALELGESSGWHALRLHDVADALQLPLTGVHACFASKDDLAEAWFDRADRTALAVRDHAGFSALSERSRLATVIMAWLDTLSPHRRVTRDMLGYKLEPGHIHLQALGIMRISRTVQWFMEAVQIDLTGPRRILMEISLTTVYLSTFAHWLFDDSPGSRETRRHLDAALQRLDKLAGRGRSRTATKDPHPAAGHRGTAAGNSTGEDPPAPMMTH
ncbi:MAG: TetR/AcrR family transcriptional regulator [Thiohalobacterales bacterium]|nr:TetR/AcrR family transcriptional regulator [Thiohalobacterales bacterium]